MRSHHGTFRPQKKFLLFSSVDTNRSAHDYWLMESDRNYDVVLYVYNGDMPEQQVELCVKRKGLKFPGFYEFSKITDIFHYDAIWITDDDIQMCTRDINRMFELFHEDDLWLAQPAYDSSSKASWELTLVDERYQVRYSNFVENGVVVLSREALKLCLPVMKDIKSGFGSDFLIPALIGFPLKKIAIIDEVQCHHPHGKSTLDKLIPRLLHRQDAEDLMAKYDFRYFTPRVMGGVRR